MVTEGVISAVLAGFAAGLSLDLGFRAVVNVFTVAGLGGESVCFADAPAFAFAAVFCRTGAGFGAGVLAMATFGLAAFAVLPATASGTAFSTADCATDFP